MRLNCAHRYRTISGFALARRPLVLAAALLTSLSACVSPPDSTSDQAEPETPPVASSNARIAEALTSSLSGPDRLVTNEYAHWNPHATDAVRSPVWDLDSGSLFVRNGVGWSGPIERGPVDAVSRTGTNSAVFRAALRFEVPRDVVFSGRFKVIRIAAPPAFTASAATRTTAPAARDVSQRNSDWEGLHLWLRYRSPQDLYVVSIARHDGLVTIKRKRPGGPVNGGTYTTLASAHAGIAPGAFRSVAVSARDDDAGTHVSLVIDGVRVLTAHDPSGDSAPSPGTVGIRGDDTEFEFTDISVVPAPGS